MSVIRALLRCVRRRERGNAILEFIVLGVSMLVPFVYIMLAVFDLQRASYAVAAAAREGSRAYTLGGNVPDAKFRAQQAVAAAMKDQNIDSYPAPSITCVGGCLQPGSTAVVTVRYSVSLPFIPPILGGARAAIPVESTHRTPYGQYRQGGG